MYNYYRASLTDSMSKAGQPANAFSSVNKEQSKSQLVNSVQTQTPSGKALNQASVNSADFFGLNFKA